MLRLLFIVCVSTWFSACVAVPGSEKGGPCNANDVCGPGLECDTTARDEDGLGVCVVGGTITLDGGS